MSSIAYVRGEVLSMIGAVGTLSAIAEAPVHAPTPPSLEVAVTQILVHAARLAESMDVDLHHACEQKLVLNDRKYPADKCQAEIQKYTHFSQVTGVNKDNQTMEPALTPRPSSRQMLEAGFLATKVRSHEFVKARGWEKHDTAPSLCLALASEVGELADLVAWKSPGGPIKDLPSLRDSIAQELADVIIILLRFAALYDVDLSRPLIYIHKHQINI